MMYTVVVGKRGYRVTEGRKDSLLEYASEKVRMGIYALQKGKDYIELRNDKYASVTQLKRAVRDFRRQGIKVYANGL